MIGTDAQHSVAELFGVNRNDADLAVGGTSQDAILGDLDQCVHRHGVAADSILEVTEVAPAKNGQRSSLRATNHLRPVSHDVQGQILVVLKVGHGHQTLRPGLPQVVHCQGAVARRRAQCVLVLAPCEVRDEIRVLLVANCCLLLPHVVQRDASIVIAHDEALLVEGNQGVACSTQLGLPKLLARFDVGHSSEAAGRGGRQSGCSGLLRTARATDQKSSSSAGPFVALQ
mmetsp:Transcript_73159/g.210063  ORF Transcript_73159/g.210063 Transcript_73159/m.210063 type:complete len:229 (+) Transcript_73159:374-1060(+)